MMIDLLILLDIAIVLLKVQSISWIIKAIVKTNQSIKVRLKNELFVSN